MPTTERPSRALFRFSGPDARKLLNDVVTCRIEAAPGPARWFALLSPQGKIQAEGNVSYADGAFWLDVDQSVADAFLKRMRMYRLRADVTIDDLRGSHKVGWNSETGGVIGGAEADWAPADATYDRERIARGIAALGPDFAPDTTFPHDIGMDFFEGVDFVKGCYVGQEVVSRMQHRGTARRRPVIVAELPESAAAGAPLMAGGREAGTIGTPIESKAVAILRLDRIADPAAATVDGVPVTLTLPDWATYAFGESGGAD